MTNGDKIRQMSNEEMAKKFSIDLPCGLCKFESLPKCTEYGCQEGIKAYLDMEVE